MVLPPGDPAAKEYLEEQELLPIEEEEEEEAPDLVNGAKPIPRHVSHVTGRRPSSALDKMHTSLKRMRMEQVNPELLASVTNSQHSGHNFENYRTVVIVH